MQLRLAFYQDNNPLFKRVAQPDAGSTPPQFIFAGSVATIAILFVLPLLSILGLNNVLTIIQAIAALAVPILVITLVLTPAVITINEIQSEPFDLIRLTKLSNKYILWGLCGGIVYRLRKTILSFMCAFGLALPPFILKVRELAKTHPDTYPPPDLSEPLWPLIPLFATIMFVAGLGIALMLIVGSVMMALRYRSVGLGATMDLLNTGIPIIIVFFLWLLFVSLPNRGLALYLSLVLFPIPYILGWILSRRWQTNITHFIILSGILPVLIFAYLLCAFILQIGSGYAKQADQFIFWTLNAIFAGWLLYFIYFNWGQALAINLLLLLTWQIIMVSILLRSEATYSISVDGSNVAFWLLCHTFLLTPYAGVLITLDRAQHLVASYLD